MEALSNEVLRKQRELFEMQACSLPRPLLNARTCPCNVIVDLAFDGMPRSQCVIAKKQQEAASTPVAEMLERDQFMIQTRGPQAKPPPRPS